MSALNKKMTDGCTNAPDEKFKTCCDIHDENYSAGTKLSRLEADNKLFKCILRKGYWFILSGVYYLVIASIYWCAVRLFGKSHYKGSIK